MTYFRLVVGVLLALLFLAVPYSALAQTDTPPPPTATSTMIPTSTPMSTATSTMAPTATSTMIPTATPTPDPLPAPDLDFNAFFAPIVVAWVIAIVLNKVAYLLLGQTLVFLGLAFFHSYTCYVGSNFLWSAATYCTPPDVVFDQAVAALNYVSAVFMALAFVDLIISKVAKGDLL